MEAQYPKCIRQNSRYHFNNVFLNEALLCDRFYLYQIGERFCNDQEEIVPHKQFCAEITYVISGKGTISTNGTRTSVAKHDCYLSFQGDIHGVHSDKDTALRYFFIGFNPADEKAEALLDEIRNGMVRENRSCVRLPELSTLFHSQLTELQGKQPYSSESIGLHLYRMLILVSRALHQSELEMHEYQTGDKSILAYKIMAYIDENFFSIKRLADMEAIFYFKYRYLEKCFISITGMTISDYYKDVRMRYAAKLLKEELSITDISERLNFSSIYSFSRAFSNFYGRSPSEFRNETKKNL